LWNKLDYFTPDIFAKRVIKAINMLKQKKFQPLEIYNTNFYSSEGYYSEIVLDTDLNIKIIGRGFDDFNTNPVILINGNLIRVNNDELLPLLNTFLTQLPSVASVKNMNGIIVSIFILYYIFILYLIFIYILANISNNNKASCRLSNAMAT
jgi:hypothetical protein